MKAQLRRWNRVNQLEVHLLHPRVKEIMVRIVQGVLESFQDLPALLSPFRAQPICFNIARVASLINPLSTDTTLAIIR